MIYPEIAILFFVFGVISGQSATRAHCVWLFKSDTHTRGGMSTSHLSLADCQTKCLEFNSCTYGLDWDPNNVNGMRCWFSTGTNIGSAPGVIHYYQSCSETTLPPSLSTNFYSSTRAHCVWLFKSDTHTRGGMSTSYLSLADCQTKCLEFNSCTYGLDWDPNNGNGMRCWFSTGTNIGSAPGVSHYYQSCAETTLPPSLATSLTTDSIFTLPSLLTTTTSTCNWVPSNNTNTKNGNLKPDANTLDACKEKCFSQLDCLSGLGFDFNANNPEGQRCYLSTSKTLYPTTGIVHYMPENTCSNFYSSTTLPPSLATTTTLTCNWISINNVYVKNGNLKPDANTLDACKEKCLSRQGCVSGFGFDFYANNPEGQRCYLSTSKTLYPTSGIVHYMPENTCSSTIINFYKKRPKMLSVNMKDLLLHCCSRRTLRAGKHLFKFLLKFTRANLQIRLAVSNGAYNRGQTV